MTYLIYIIKFKIITPILQILSFFFKDINKFKNKDFVYYTNDNVDPLSKLLMKFNLHEAREIKFSKYLFDKMHTIEAGGGIGLMSLYIRKKIDNAKFIILEPNTLFHPLIKNNLKVNNFSLENTLLLNKALSVGKPKKIKFIQQQNPFANKIYSENKTYNYSIKKDEIEVETTTINQIIKDYGLGDFQLIMDIEGEEYNVFLKDNGWLERCKCIIYECHYRNKELEKINNYLIKSGFKMIKKNENIFLFKK